VLDGKAITPMKGKGQKSECGNYMITAKRETEPNILMPSHARKKAEGSTAV
jgi:hypothetical protein